jgi:tetratricopeptide (TPR) repeat protein
MLLATATHCRGAVYFHQRRVDQALASLHEALKLFGAEHSATGRVLDTLGMVYASKNNFQSAREFYEKAIDYKRRFQDDASIALSHGQLGRLHLDLGDLSRADKHFQNDLEISERIGDKRGVAQMYNHLGQVALARHQWQKVAGWLDEGIRLSQEGKWSILEGYARKDRALASLGLGKHDEAETQLQLAAGLFQERRVRGR